MKAASYSSTSSALQLSGRLSSRHLRRQGFHGGTLLSRGGKPMRLCCIDLQMGLQLV